MPHCPFLFPERVAVQSGPEHSRLGPHSSPPSQKRRWEMCLRRKREREVVKFKEDTGKRETDAEGCRSTVRSARRAVELQQPRHRRRPHLLHVWMGGSWEKEDLISPRAACLCFHHGDWAHPAGQEWKREVRVRTAGWLEPLIRLLPHLLPPPLPPLS